MKIWEKNISGRGKIKGSSLQLGMNLVCTKTRLKSSVPETVVQGEVGGEGEGPCGH